MRTKGEKAILVLFILIFAAGIIIGIPMAVFGSQSDVSPGEQAGALVFGAGMIVFGTVGFVGAVKSNARLRIPLICAGGTIASFLLAWVFGP